MGPKPQGNVGSSKRKAPMEPRKKSSGAGPKRKGPGESSSPDFDGGRFLSAEKEEYFRTVLVDLVCVRERYFANFEVDEFGIRDVLVKRGWLHWLVPSEKKPACATLVKEFYANARFDNQQNKPAVPPYTSWFRGVEVDYSASALRTFLQLKTEEEEKQIFPGPTYQDLIDGKITTARHFDIDRTLLLPGQSVIDDAHGKSKMALRSQLLPIARVWAQVIQETLIPSSHTTEVRWNALLAIYCILKGYPIDVARIISYRIYKQYNMGKEKPRPTYPHLIHELTTHTYFAESGEGEYVIEQQIKPYRRLDLPEMRRIHEEVVRRMPPPPQDGSGPSNAPVHDVPLDAQVQPPPQQYDFQPPWMAEAFGRMFWRQEQQHRATDMLWQAGGYTNPEYPYVSPFNDLEQRMVDLSLHTQAGGAGGDDYDDGDGFDGHDDGGDPMNEF